MLPWPPFPFLAQAGSRELVPRPLENGTSAPRRSRVFAAGSTGPGADGSDRQLDPRLLEALFNELPDVVFFVKDAAGRYSGVNDTLMARCGFQKREMILGLTAEEAYPKPLGAAYAAGLAVGFWNSEDDIRNNWAEDKRWEPQMDSAKRDEYYKYWKRAVTRTFDWFDSDS